MAPAARGVGEELTDFLMPRLFEPFRLPGRFGKSLEGYTKGAPGCTNTEDIAKFGQFYLQRRLERRTVAF